MVKSACLYLLCLLVRDLHESLHLSDSVIPWWSEFPSGGLTEQYLNKKQATCPDLIYGGEVRSTAFEKANALHFSQPVSFPQLTLDYATDLPSQDCPVEMLCTEV